MKYVDQWDDGYVGAFESAGATMKDQYAFVGWTKEGILIHSVQLDHEEFRKYHDYRPEEGTYRYSTHPCNFQDGAPTTVRHVRETISAYEKAYMNKTPVQLILRKGGNHSRDRGKGMCKWLSKETWRVKRIDKCSIYIDVYLEKI